MNRLFVIPFVSALAGWLITRLALRLLFHPQKPVKILGFTVQGIFPRKRNNYALKLGKLASDNFFSFTEIEKKIGDPANIEKILPILEIHIDTFLREKLPAQIPMLGMLIGDKTIAQVKAVFMKELEEIFPTLINEYMGSLHNELNFEKIVMEKASAFSNEKLEDIFKKTLSAELTSVEIFGAVLGFIIGLIQVCITAAILQK